MIKKLAVAMLAALTLSSCGHKIDEQAWRATDEAILGHAYVDWPKYKRTVLDWCDDDDQQFNLTVTTLLDDPPTGDVESEKATLTTDVKYACPDRSDDLDAALQTYH